MLLEDEVDGHGGGVVIVPDVAEGGEISKVLAETGCKNISSGLEKEALAIILVKSQIDRLQWRYCWPG